VPRLANPLDLSPAALKFYTDSVEKMGAKFSQMLLEYRDHYVLDDDMNPVEAPFVEWAVMYAGPNHNERVIRRDEIGKWLVSTVFLGMDHGFNYRESATYRPILFETMIFYEAFHPANTSRWLDKRQWRYCTTPEAVAGHDHAVELVRRHQRLPRKLKKALGTPNDCWTPGQRQLVGAYVRRIDG